MHSPFTPAAAEWFGPGLRYAEGIDCRLCVGRWLSLLGIGRQCRISEYSTLLLAAAAAWFYVSVPLGFTTIPARTAHHLEGNLTLISLPRLGCTSTTVKP